MLLLLMFRCSAPSRSLFIPRNRSDVRVQMAAPPPQKTSANLVAIGSGGCMMPVFAEVQNETTSCAAQRPKS